MGAQRYVDHPTLGWMTLEKYNEISPLIRPRRAYVLAADHDRIVAEAEARGWNAAVEAVPHSEICLSLDPDADERDCDCYHRIVVAALRRPEVEG